jgi:metal-responsive CopG/Arc/MetJ family transcriptional regulator
MPMGYNVKLFNTNSDTAFMETTQISFRLDKDLLELIDGLAKRDLRTRTNMIEFILTNWLREHESESFNDDGTILK